MPCDSRCRTMASARWPASSGQFAGANTTTPRDGSPSGIGISTKPRGPAGPADAPRDATWSTTAPSPPSGLSASQSTKAPAAATTMASVLTAFIRAAPASAALRVAAVQAGRAAVHDHDRLGAALVAHGGRRREAGAVAGERHVFAAAVAALLGQELADRAGLGGGYVGVSVFF